MINRRSGHWKVTALSPQILEKAGRKHKILISLFVNWVLLENIAGLQFLNADFVLFN